MRPSISGEESNANKTARRDVGEKKFRAEGKRRRVGWGGGRNKGKGEGGRGGKDVGGKGGKGAKEGERREGEIVRSREKSKEERDGEGWEIRRKEIG